MIMGGEMNNRFGQIIQAQEKEKEEKSYNSYREDKQKINEG